MNSLAAPNTVRADAERSDSDRAPNAVDLHVGMRIRLRRRALGVSQDRLARALGLTFQQVQKYERGSNRVSASKLYDIARTLQAPIGFFFDGLADPVHLAPGAMAEPEGAEFVYELVMSPEGMELAALFPRVDRRGRRVILDMVRALATPDGLDEDEPGLERQPDAHGSMV